MGHDITKLQGLKKEAKKAGHHAVLVTMFGQKRKRYLPAEKHPSDSMGRFHFSSRNRASQIKKENRTKLYKIFFALPLFAVREKYKELVKALLLHADGDRLKKIPGEIPK